MKDLERYIQPFLFISLVLFMFCLFFFTIPPTNMEILKMCLTAIISFISGTSLAVAMLKASYEEDRLNNKRKSLKK
jgi:ABC-type polysaccharide/polyol phosphate export permease